MDTPLEQTDDIRFDETRKFLDKWSMYNLLKQHPPIVPMLPESKQFTKEHFFYFCQRYESFYIKPVNTWGGQSITRVDHFPNQLYCIRTLGQPTVWRATAFGSWWTVRKRLPLASIIQQAAPVVTWNNRMFDIRVLMQRHKSGTWMYAAMAARVGGHESIVSNIAASGGEVHEVPQLLQSLFENPPIEQKILQNLRTFSRQICTLLDSVYSFEEVGIDWGLGYDGSLWLFEVNTNDNLGGPSHELFAPLADGRIYQRIEQRSSARRLAQANEWLQIWMTELQQMTEQTP